MPVRARLRSILAMAAVLPWSGGCAAPPPARGEVPAAVAPAPAAGGGLLVVVHGGQGSAADRSDGPAAATAAALKSIGTGGSALDAALAAVRLLEDDPRFNAGTGASLRVDGASIQCEAAVMDDMGRFGAIAGIQGIRHPVDAALAVAGSPHGFLSGPGAQLFADSLGLEPASLITEQARQRLARGYSAMFEPREGSPWKTFDWRRHWNFPTPPPATLAEAVARTQAGAPSTAAGSDVGPEGTQGTDPEDTKDTKDTKDTVGAVVRTADGRYAAALSTGGSTLALNGRVGDVPQLGAGLYVGPRGAVAATGKGEAITRERVAVRVYDLLAAGVEPNAAIRRVIRDISSAEGVGVIAVSEAGLGVAATSQMAWAADGVTGPRRGDNVVW